MLAGSSAANNSMFHVLEALRFGVQYEALVGGYGFDGVVVGVDAGGEEW